MNLTKLLNDYHLPWAQPGERHYREGWVNMPCPFCYGSGNPGNHLGYCIDKRSSFYGRFVCWRCGGHGLHKTLATLLKVPEKAVEGIISTYGGITLPRRVQTLPRPNLRALLRDIAWPFGTKPLKQVLGACRYLEGRGFDVEELVNVWNVNATGPSGGVAYGEGKLLDLSRRMIVPIYREGYMVSWQARDWTGKAKLKYLTCPPELEAWHHKALLYGTDKVTGGRVLLVEGVTDVWALGPGAIACFGIKYRPEQVKELMHWPEVWLVLDREWRAQLQARLITRELKEAGVLVKQVWLPPGKDPAELTEKEKISLLRS